MKNLITFPRFIFASISIVFGIVSGCTTPSISNTPISAHVLIDDDLTPTPSLILQSSITPITIVTTSFPSHTATPTLYTSLTGTVTPDEICSSRPQEFTSEMLVPGTIIFSENDGLSETHLFSLSLPSMTVHPFWNELAPGILGRFLVSPNGKMLAFTHEKLANQLVSGHDLIVTTSNQKDFVIVPRGDEDGGHLIVNWLFDNQHLVINPRSEYDPFAREDVIIVLNPFTGDQNYVTPSFALTEDSLSLYDGYVWEFYGMTAVYDPTLSRVFYLDFEDTAVLWDMEKQRELWRYTDPVMLGQWPAWTQDGSTLAVLGLKGSITDLVSGKAGFQFLFVKPDGEAIQSKSFPYYFGLNPYFYWSPDGHYLVFSWKPSENDPYKLLLYDAISQDVLDFCLTNVTSSAVWAPNSQQLIVQVEDEKDVFRNLIIDVVSGKMMSLSNIALRPEAWLITTP